MRQGAHSAIRAFLSATQAKSGLIIAGSTFLAALLCSLALAAHDASYVNLMLHDHFVYLDGLHRIAAGQIPHVDFHTPTGALYYLLPYWGFELAGTYAGAMPMAMAIATSAIALPIAYVLSTRFRDFWLAVPIAIYLLLLLAGPALLGWSPWGVTMAMWYNRVAWALLCLEFLLYVRPHLARPGSRWADALVVFFVNLACFYLKLTYFAVSASFAVFLLFVDRKRRLSMAVGLALLFLAVAVVELRWHLHRDYFADLVTTIHVSGALRGSSGGFSGGLFGPLRPMMAPLEANLHEIVLVVMAWSFLLVTRLATGRDLLFVSFVVGASAAIWNQNYQPAHLPPLVVLLGYAGHVAVQAAKEPGSKLQWGAAYGVVALLLVFLAQPLHWQAAALAQHFVHTRNVPSELDVPTPLRGFRVEDKGLGPLMEIQPEVRAALDGGDFDRLRSYMNPAQTLFQREYLLTVLKGVEALRGILRGRERIVTFDFASPFAFLLDHPPARGDFSFFHRHRNLSDRFHPDASALLSATDIVMVPKRPVTAGTRDLLLDLYQEHLASYFRVATETDFWVVWARR